MVPRQWIGAELKFGEYIMKKFLKDESGATAIEYGLLAALMGTAIVGIGSTFGSAIQDGFNTLGLNFKANASF
jgi:pilus assembly protein Flp/PilA